MVELDSVDGEAKIFFSIIATEALYNLKKILVPLYMWNVWTSKQQGHQCWQAVTWITV